MANTASRLENTFEESDVSVINFLQNISEPTTVIVDFDETLLTRNSTEEYLNTVWPGIFGYFVLSILAWCKPWKYLPKQYQSKKVQDWIRVVAITILFPWTILIWRTYHAKKIARAYENERLTKVIKSNSNLRIIIASYGFSFIIQPIVGNLSVSVEGIYACRLLNGVKDRIIGKNSLLQKSMPISEIQKSVFVTDSRDDLDLLAIVSHPFLVQWEECRYVPALSSLYLPFYYLEKVKRPGKKSILNIILKNHWLTFVFALSWVSPNSFLHAASMFCFVISFWCIYEAGYYENDRVAEAYEAKPTLSEVYITYRAKEVGWHSWSYATFFSTVGILFLYLSGSVYKYSFLSRETLLKHTVLQLLIPLFIWIGVLLSMRLAFLIYNHVDKVSRIFLYPILQVFKYFGIFAVASSNSLGSILLITQVLFEWIPYVIYRYSEENRYSQIPLQVLRASIFFYLVIPALLFSKDISLVLNWQFLFISTWLVVRSQSDIKVLVHQVHFIKRDRLC